MDEGVPGRSPPRRAPTEWSFPRLWRWLQTVDLPGWRCRVRSRTRGAPRSRIGGQRGGDPHLGRYDWGSTGCGCSGECRLSPPRRSTTPGELGPRLPVLGRSQARRAPRHPALRARGPRRCSWPWCGWGRFAIAVAQLAVAAGYPGLLHLAAGMCATLAAAYAEGSFATRMRAFTRPSVLVIDDVGLIPRPTAGNVFYQVVNRLGHV
ncbi:MAG: ATP-binding protein [Actinomycetota bacterium]